MTKIMKENDKCFGNWKNENKECEDCIVRHSCRTKTIKGSIRGYCRNCGGMSYFKNRKCITCLKTYTTVL